MSASRSLPNFGAACCVIKGGKAVKDWYKLPLAMGPMHKLPWHWDRGRCAYQGVDFPGFELRFLRYTFW